MKWGIYTVCMLLGVTVGALIAPSEEPKLVAADDPQQIKNTRKHYQILDAGSVGGEDRADQAYQQIDSLQELAVKMNEEKLSPLRAKSFLGSRIQQLSKDELLDKLRAGEIQTTDELAVVARRLTEESPHEVFDIYEKPSVPFRSMDGLYAFFNSMVWTWLQKDPASLQKRIQGLPRGGAQQDISLRFSGFWAQLDPAAASEQFEDLVYLRNMTVRGKQELRGDVYADMLVKSWSLKDAVGLQRYIDELPEGEKKELYLQSWLKAQK